MRAKTPQGELTLSMRRRQDGVRWDAVEWSDKASTKADVAPIKRTAAREGVTFRPHPSTTAIPWMVPTYTEPTGVLCSVGKQRQRNLRRADRAALVTKVAKVVQAGEQHIWTQHIWTRHIQLRTPEEIWTARGAVTTFQMWVAYRGATAQFNLYHPGREIDARYPVDTGCGTTRETTPHIMWDCMRARSTWRGIFERWTGKKAAMEDLNLLLPHTANRTPPTTTQHVKERINKCFGFFTTNHLAALQTIWFIVATVTPSALWRQRNATVFQQRAATAEETSEHMWRACAHQIRAVASQQSTDRGKRFVGISMRQCLSVLEETKQEMKPIGWNQARLYFDGGARGNPGPGGSGWALTARGYTYKGHNVTNNTCECKALQEGMAFATNELNGMATHLAVFGDSNMIIDAQNGLATISAEHLRESSARVDELAGSNAWISWHHVKREHNKMADLLANIAMDSKESRIHRPDAPGHDWERVRHIQQNMENDIRGIPSAWKRIAITEMLRKF